jgi:SAM-dependent methyltransferase
MAQVDEPVVESAPLARWVAERLCRADPGTGETCAWYHGFWQYLRVLDLVTTPAHHADFLREAFRGAAGDGNRLRVLISGAIDYSMLAGVLWACGLHAVSAEVTVVDICDTPLFLNHWYARRVGCRIRSFRSDILDHPAEAAYDVVCTHSLLGQFAPARRNELVARWRQALRPGGRVITVNRIRPDGGAERAGFSPEQARALREAAMCLSPVQCEQLEIPPDELVRGAERYAARRRPYPVRSREELAALFEEAGFTLEHLSCAPVAATHAIAVSGPTIAGGAEYARLVARRP